MVPITAHTMKKGLIQRWSEPHFVAEVGPLIRAFSLGKKLPANADLRGIITGLDGAWPELLHGDFIGVSLEGVDASYGRFSCSFSQARAVKCRFEGAFFDTCNFGAASLSMCNFLNAKLDSPHLNDANFNECVFEDVRISGRGANEYGGRRVTFTNCTFKNAVLQNLQFRATTFQNCTFEGTQFRKCLLAGVKFQESAPAKDAFQNCQMQLVQVDGQPIK